MTWCSVNLFIDIYGRCVILYVDVLHTNTQRLGTGFYSDDPHNYDYQYMLLFQSNKKIWINIIL